MEGLHTKWPLVTYSLVSRKLNKIALLDLLASKDGVMNSAYDWNLNHEKCRISYYGSLTH